MVRGWDAGDGWDRYGGVSENSRRMIAGRAGQVVDSSIVR